MFHFLAYIWYKKCITKIYKEIIMNILRKSVKIQIESLCTLKTSALSQDVINDVKTWLVDLDSATDSDLLYMQTALNNLFSIAAGAVISVEYVQNMLNEFVINLTKELHTIEDVTARKVINHKFECSIN